MNALLGFVVLYLLGTLAIGVYAGTRVKNSADFAVAGRSLPLVMIITTTFATWFGAETVLGISAKFVAGGLNAVVEDPFGASMCLVFVGIFFAAKLYRMNLLTIGDFYRKRYGKGVEIFCSVAIILSYLGWVAAQITALGLVFNVVSGGEISTEVGMFIGTASVLVYVLFGGMLAVAWTDFIQMIVLVVGLSLIAVMAGNQAGGADKVFDLAVANDWPFHRQSDDELAAEISGQWCHYKLWFAWHPELGVMHLSCALDMKVPVKKRTPVYALLAMANEKLWLGHFDLWADEGLPVFRHAVLFREGIGANAELIEDLVDIAVSECERFYPAFQFVIWGGKDAAEAITAALLETEGEA